MGADKDLFVIPLPLAARQQQHDQAQKENANPQRNVVCALVPTVAVPARGRGKDGHDTPCKVNGPKRQKEYVYFSLFAHWLHHSVFHIDL
jgi:hypothetical protein